MMQHAGLRTGPETAEQDHLEHLLDQRFQAAACRGLTNGYARPKAQRSRALVVGCNYPRKKHMRLWGACADARAWASTLCSRLGVPEEGLALLVDEDGAGAPVDESDRVFPSQRNMQEHLAWLTRGVQPGDFLAFVFCGRGTLILENSDREAEPGKDDEGAEAFVEEALLCGDFDCADWQNGRSMRLLDASWVSAHLAQLPRGSSLALVMDCEHGVSMLPVLRRLDSARLPPTLRLDGEPTPVLEAMVFGVTQSREDVVRDLRNGQLGQPPLEAEPHRGDRGCKGLFPRRQWTPGDLLWKGQDEPADDGKIQQEVQAFAFSACGPGGRAFESEDLASKRRRGGRPAARRGLLSQCLLRSLEDLNFQGSYYALWWGAVRLLRQAEAGEGQHFQLTFNDGTDPTCREAFEPIQEAEAKAYLKRAELDRVSIDDGAHTHRLHARACCANHKFNELQRPELPPARLGSSLGCSVTDPDGDVCAMM
eukprot:TRINITY_DN61853_c0_g1_i1.p1 TRINITY_DN61853_c0_g1~~TRINITY_DN61853_c0_g1_i1.p1  ORF type:complete len:481 (-),score=92.57 TRINITY_DN61853_c0_g1_i1:45-1487(-)